MWQVENLNSILAAFKIAALCNNFSEYKNACFYDIELKPGAKVRDIEKYSTELSLALKKAGKPRLIISPEEGIIQLEFLNSKREKTSLFDIAYQIERPEGKLTCLLGETLQNDPLWIDIAANPHLLIAGTTGSGKSTLLHTIIANLLLYPKVSIHLMDPKNIEFYKYSEANLPKLNVAHEFADCLIMIESLCLEMDSRYQKIKERKLFADNFPFIVLIIDEYADLIMQDENKLFYKSLIRLAQKSRAAGIHLIMSTQRPSVDVIDGIIKANFPARISCKVSSHIDSRIILDAVGAERLIGSGDALIRDSKFDLQRFQVAYTSPDEVCCLFGKK